MAKNCNLDVLNLFNRLVGVGAGDNLLLYPKGRITKDLWEQF